MTAQRWLIDGRVQGVGFRWFTVRQAQKVGVSGWVRNLPDGRVEVVAVGDRDRLQALEAAIRRGPTGAYVESVEKADYPHEGDLGNTFTVK